MASTAKTALPASTAAGHGLLRELGLRDLVLAQVLCVVGSAWVGVAAKLGNAHVAFWIAAMLLYYLPLAAVVIHLNREMPLEGGLYQWAKFGFGEFLGFLTAWNLWAYAIVCVASVLFVIPTDLFYIIGARAEWLPSSRIATPALIAVVIAAIALGAIRGLAIGKWLHNIGSVMILSAYAILVCLPFWAKLKGNPIAYTPIPWKMPEASWFSLAVFGQMTIGALSGFEYVAIMAGECRSAARTIGQSVLISAPVIALMFILGTSSVLAFSGESSINLIGPIPQTFRLAFGASGLGAIVAPIAILLVLSRAIAAASLIFTGLTRLPMAAGWDHLLPAWFTALHPRWRTPVNSILFVGTLVVILVVLSMLGVHEQEAMQLLQNASTAHYGITYVALFALPLFGAARLRRILPRWLKFVAAAGFVSSLIAVLIAVYPIISVSSNLNYAAKIGGTVLVSNLMAITIYWSRSSGARNGPFSPQSDGGSGASFRPWRSICSRRLHQPTRAARYSNQHEPQRERLRQCPDGEFYENSKYEDVYRQEYRDLPDALRSLRRFIEKVYNEKRLHSALGYLSPSEFETHLVVANNWKETASRRRSSACLTACVTSLYPKGFETS